ncbi:MULTISPECIES: DUF1990 family protein [unclassified Microbacterium]|uniref:DUF1990 family protein n=2 Tax=Microbacterium TaxID=33882 RepID=UPI000DE38F3C|nr:MULTISPECIES: DUF1990 family protein [unclassified Microbacterium]NYF28527.1 uncharacterized protein (UPF0548 family) [Microbacterium sp. JAI119]RBO72372.1 DUF1990 domain-containing protein [Microbacterium sp. H6]
MTRGPIRAVPKGMRLSERSTVVGPAARTAVAALVSSWDFKRRAGFEVPVGAPAAGVEGVLAKRLLGIRFVEPVRVVWADENGFGYETRPGHPIYGEESFLIDEHGVFVARSVSRPSTWFWRLLAPALLLLQRATHDRYVRIVQDEAGASSVSRRATM